jgi:hypothetical protein
VAEWLKAAVLKTAKRKRFGGSNPSPSDLTRLYFAIGVLRGLVSEKCQGLDTEDLEKLSVVDTIIEEVIYQRKPLNNDAEGL